MPCQCTLCSDAGWALDYVHQDLSSRCLGLHFMINIKKVLFQQRCITWGFQAWRAGGQPQCSVSPAWL